MNMAWVYNPHVIESGVARTGVAPFRLILTFTNMLTEKELVDRHILCDQSTVVEELIKSGAIPDESLYGEWYEVLEWWLVTNWLAERLRDEGEVIVEDCGCHWWGRTTSGQAIYMDSVIREIGKT